ncbi:MAG TPA: hypothetical protein PKZ99_09910 [Azospirillaceae bacterium]|nr:hypothetical protein [Azospirillaceae bacterium]
MDFADELDGLIAKAKAEGVDLDTMIADLRGAAEGLIAESADEG